MPRAGVDPCYIISDGKYVITANYTGGDISVFSLDAEGKLQVLNGELVFPREDAGVLESAVGLAPEVGGLAVAVLHNLHTRTIGRLCGNELLGFRIVDTSRYRTRYSDRKSVV